MKDIAVIGLGKFGFSIAKEYSEMGGNVLAIDMDEEKVQDISPFVTYAVKADVTDTDVVKSLGLSNMDVVVVAIADHMEASIMATILAKEEGVPYVLVKSQSQIHAKVLKKVGADEIIFPEKEMGKRIAHRLSVKNLVESMNLSDKFTIAEVKIPKNWIGKNLIEINARKKYGINIIMKKIDDNVDINLDPKQPLEENCILVVLGEQNIIEKVFQ